MNRYGDAMNFLDKRFTAFGAPGRYIQGKGVVHLVGPCCATLGSNAVLLSDRTVTALVASVVASSCKAANVDLSFVDFEGDIDASTGPALATQVDRSASPAIIAAGGGRAIDAGKALRDILHSPLLTLPTVASNDAPTSKNYVLYDGDHRLIEVRHMTHNPEFVLVDTAFIASAPKHFFLAGLGDAIAKMFEADQCFAASGRTMFQARSTRTANAIARECYHQLLMNAEAAYAVAGTGEVTDAFDAAVEAMILMAGLGFENGGLSVAHALTRGLSHVPGAKTAPHGLQVAYGLLVQFELEGHPPPKELVALYRAVGLPLTFAQLAGMPASTETYESIAGPSARAPHIQNFSRPINTRDLVSAMVGVERRYSETMAMI